MSLAKLKKELREMPTEQIIEVVADLYQKVPRAKEYLELFLSADVAQLAEK